MDPFSHDPFAVPVDEGETGRQDARDSLFLMADVRLAGSASARQVRVRNLSSGGLMAEYPEGLAQGVAVEIDVRGIGWVPGQVAWSTSGRIGVAFDREIDPLLARKRVGQGATTPVFTKPILTRGKSR